VSRSVLELARVWPTRPRDVGDLIFLQPHHYLSERRGFYFLSIEYSGAPSLMVFKGECFDLISNDSK